MHVRNKKRGISSLYLRSLWLLFLLFLLFPSPQQIRNREFRHYIYFFAAFLFGFSFFFNMRLSFTVVICQCLPTAAAKPSTAFDVCYVLLYHIHVGATIFTALPRKDDDNDGAEEQRGRWNLGKVNREEWKILWSITFCAVGLRRVALAIV